MSVAISSNFSKMCWAGTGLQEMVTRWILQAWGFALLCFAGCSGGSTARIKNAGVCLECQGDRQRNCKKTSFLGNSWAGWRSLARVVLYGGENPKKVNKEERKGSLKYSCPLCTAEEWKTVLCEYLGVQCPPHFWLGSLRVGWCLVAPQTVPMCTCQVSEQFGNSNFSFFPFPPALSSLPTEVMGVGWGLKSHQNYGTTGALTRACTKLCFKSSKSCCCLPALQLCQALQQPVMKGWLCPVYIVGRGLCLLAKTAEWTVGSCYSF